MLHTQEVTDSNSVTPTNFKNRDWNQSTGAGSVTGTISTLQGALRRTASATLPKSQTGKAIDYTLGLWNKLLVYTEHVEIDNNLVENAIRPTAIGKKNWLFFGSAGAGKTSAIIYTLLETCRKLSLNPDEYLRDVLRQLPSMTNQTAKDYTPAQRKAARELEHG